MKVSNPWAGIEPPTGDLSALRVDSQHPLDLFWAVSSTSDYLFIYKVLGCNMPKQKQLPLLTGVAITAETIDAGSGVIALKLRERANWELFLALCSDLIESTRNVIPGEASLAA